MREKLWPGAQWEVIPPEAAGMSSSKLNALELAIQSGFGNMNGIVVVRDARIVFERYYNGYGPEDAHHVASVTKSVLSALVGIAMEDGAMDSPEQQIMRVFPEYAEHGEEETGVRSQVTLGHLLTMTAPYPFPDWQERLDELCMQPDWVGYTLGRLGRQGALGAFKYSTAGAHLMSAALTRCTGKSARQFANERLFGPIGMQTIPDYIMEGYGFDELFGSKVKGWVHDPAGNSTGGWGLTLTPRDMARFGWLYVQGGSWHGEQIVPPAWVEESTTAHTPQYGYLWWLHEEDGVKAYAAIGDSGNMICCVPACGLVVAAASSYTPEPRDCLRLVREYILPATYDKMNDGRIV